MDSLSEERLTRVFPPLANRIRDMARNLEMEGVSIRVVQGLRTWAEQDALFEKGRNPNGEIVNRAEVVTNCPAGKSYHNFGLAVDCVPSTHGPGCSFDPDWNSHHPVWKRMLQAGTELGLCSGATWRTFPDFPHFQITGRFPEGSPSLELRDVFRRGGLEAVWAEVEESLQTPPNEAGQP